MSKRVIVVPYDKQWKSDFEIIKQHLLTTVKENIVGIEHNGSTSVEGLSAKPIIDIDIVIKDYSVFDSNSQQSFAVEFQMQRRAATVGNRLIRKVSCAGDTKVL